MENLNSIQKFYVGKTIFITGASGFMGKVLIEKLLYSCTEVEKIIILMRPKYGKSVQRRIEGFFKLTIFKRILEEKPFALKKIVPVFGDVTKPNFDLNAEHLQLVTENTQIFFHMAASLRLEATLRPNVITNLVGTKNALDVGKKMKKLIQMIHLSTAFCNIEPVEALEKVYDDKHSPQDLIRCSEWMSEEAMEALQKKILGLHPNTYTYTKRLAEILVQSEYDNLPVCIVRPTIVTPSLNEPVPGWVDSLNGPIGVMYAAGKGVLRSMIIRKDGKFENIPVDIAINALIVIAEKVATIAEKPIEIPVFHSTIYKPRLLTFQQVFEKVLAIGKYYPYSWALWYPGGGPTTSCMRHRIRVFLFQWIPAYLIDCLLLVFRQKPFLIRIQKRISVGTEVIQFFSTRNWNFDAKKYEALFELMNQDEHKMFPIDTRTIGDETEYIKRCILGTREYCVRDPPSTLPTARRYINFLFVMHYTFVGFFWYYVIQFMLNLLGLYDPLVKSFSF